MIGISVLADEKKVAKKSSSIVARIMGWPRMNCTFSDRPQADGAILSALYLLAIGPIKIRARMTDIKEKPLIR
jgi:hypothetical protein